MKMIPIALDPVPCPVKVDSPLVKPRTPQIDHFVDRISDSLQATLDYIAPLKKGGSDITHVNL